MYGQLVFCPVLTGSSMAADDSTADSGQRFGDPRTPERDIYWSHRFEPQNDV